jgi:hypothetical protein
MGMAAQAQDGTPVAQGQAAHDGTPAPQVVQTAQDGTLMDPPSRKRLRTGGDAALDDG